MNGSPSRDINALSSGILAVTGIGLLLMPGHMQIILAGLPGWVTIAIGFLCYLTALASQMVFAIQVIRRRETLIRIAMTALLVVLCGMFAHAGLWIEAFLLIVVGVLQLITAIPGWNNRFPEINLQRVLTILVNIVTGIFLISTTPDLEHPYFRLGLYNPLLAGAFLLTAGVGAIYMHSPASNRHFILTRLSALPWLAWCVIFTFPPSLPNIIPPASIAAGILVGGILPWHRIRLPDDDVLGHRVVMTGGTVLLMVLIFLSALLGQTDKHLANHSGVIISAREAAFLFLLLISMVMYYGISTILMAINGLMSELGETNEEDPLSRRDERLILWNERVARYLKPFALTGEGMRLRMLSQSDQINTLSRQLSTERHRNAQFTLLAELSQQLENQLDPPVSAQLAVNTLERAMSCSLVCIYVHEPERREFMLLAAAGFQTNLIPPGYRQKTTAGVIGRAVRQRKTQIVADVRVDSDYIFFENETNLSAVVVPLIFNGHANGCIVVNSEKVNAFSGIDVALIEAAAAELMRAWERSGYQQRLTELIQAGSLLSAMVEPEATAREIASISREILQARFTFVQIQLGQEGDFLQSASSGDAPRLLKSLSQQKDMDELIKAAFHASQPFRVRDVRKYSSTSHLEIDHSGLRCMLAIPIRWHRLSIGAILAFGKQNEVFFTENDESLAELLSIQAAGAFESTWLQQELRSSLRTTSLLYRLSTQIIQADEMQAAALDIAQTAHKLGKGSSTGIVLFGANGQVEAEVEVDENGAHSGGNHPMDTIKQVMESGQLIYFSHGQAATRACLPIQTPIRKYGALWVNIPEVRGHKPANPADLQTIVNQAAIALERSLFLVESRRQAREIKAAFDTLEATYDQTLAALMSALDARDRETEGHSMRVSLLARKFGELLGMSPQELKTLERGSLLHDIGKIGISDSILHKPGPLDENEWKIMRLHPEIGAHIVDGIPFLQETLPVIRCHQERWDGSGYPFGLSGEEIPLLARLFAVVDAFDALTSDRPYRQKVSAEEAFQFIQEQAGVLFDPGIVSIFEQLIVDGRAAKLLACD